MEARLAVAVSALFKFPARSKLAALVSSPVPRIAGASPAGAASVPPAAGKDVGGIVASFVEEAQSYPLVECARRRVLGIQAGLDALATNVEIALMQLDANRDAALAAIHAAGVDKEAILVACAAGVDTVHSAAATKRVGLETELVAADAALGEAIDAATAITEALASPDDAALALLAPSLSERFVAAQAAVAAIPERPVTSSFLVAKPLPATKSLRAKGAAELLGVLAVICVAEPPADLSPEQVAQLQAWLPPSDPSSRGVWVEVYRATMHGFAAEDFHERCDGRTRLLVLVRAQKGGWLFGGFSATGFNPPMGYVADSSAFLFSLTNSLGRPEKLESKRTGEDIYYHPAVSAIFGNCNGNDLFICGSADAVPRSYTNTGYAYAASRDGVHPMAGGWQKGWLAAEVVAWAV